MLIVDNHPLSRKGLSAIVVGEGLSVRGAVGSAGEAWTILKTHVPDLIIVDIKLPDEKGPGFVHRLREVAPETPILVFTEDTSCLTTLFRGGVRGFVLKQGTRVEEELVEGIRTVLAGKYYASPEVCGAILSTLAEGPPFSVVERLSRREREVFEGLGRGMSLREIAGRLGLSSKTVDTFFRRIKEKLGLSDRAEVRRMAGRWVEEHGACAFEQDPGNADS
ncbi:response regulator [Rhodocaloribacter sp.]